MSTLTDRLTAISRDPISPPSAEVVEQDLARGRRARRRRGISIAGGVTAIVAVGAVAGALASSTNRPNAPSSAVRPPHSLPASGAATRPTRVELVAYTGQEPMGFNFGKIPEGYDLELQASTPNEVLIAPIGDTNSDPDSFEGKLVVTAEAASEFQGLSSLGTDAITVDGNPGRIGDDGTATQVWWQVGTTIIDAQCWDSVGLTHAQLVDFADSVSVTSNVQLSHG